MNVIFRRFVLLCLFILPANLPARAQEQPALDAAERVVGAMRLEDTMRAVLPLFWQQISQAMIAANPAIKGDLDQLSPVMQGLFIESLPVFRKEMVLLYARKFSTDDLTKLGDFMSTPTGQKFASEQGALAQEGMKIGQAWGQAIGPRIVDALKNELRKKGHNI